MGGIIRIALGPFFGAITATIGWLGRTVLGGLLSQLVLGLLVRVGLVVAFFIATNVAVQKLLTMAQGYVSSLPGDLIALMTLTGLVNAMNIIASAYLFKLTLKIDAVKLLGSKT